MRAEAHLAPIGAEVELAVRVAEALQEMRPLEGRHHVDPVLGIERFEAGALGVDQRPVDQFARAHVEARMLRAHARREIADDLMVAAAFARRLDQLAAEQHMRVAAALVDVVMLEEHGGGQHDVGEFRRLGHELLVDAGEQVLARQPLLHLGLVGRDRGRVGVLHEQHLHRRAALRGRKDRSAARGRCGSGRGCGCRAS